VVDLAGRAAKHQAATGVVDRDRDKGRPTVALVAAAVAAATAAGGGGFVAVAAAAAVQCLPVLVLSTWKGRA